MNLKERMLKMLQKQQGQKSKFNRKARFNRRASLNIDDLVTTPDGFHGIVTEILEDGTYNVAVMTAKEKTEPGSDVIKFLSVTQNFAEGDLQKAENFVP